MKYRIYNAVETIKDFFSEKPLVGDCLTKTAESDACALAALARQTAFFRARNGHTYWYYILMNGTDIDLARMLLARNGVDAEKHYTSLNNGKEPVLRVRKRLLESKSYSKQFVTNIDDNWMKRDTTTEQQNIKLLRQEFAKQKAR